MGLPATAHGAALPLLRLLFVQLLPCPLAAEEAGGADVGHGEGMALGLMPIAGIFLVMGVYFFTHWRDHDIRKMTWSTINNTLSIFCAVILFNNVSELVDYILQVERRTRVGRIWMFGAYTAFWYLCFFFALLFCAGVGKGIVWRKDVLESRDRLCEVRNRMKFCLIFAHTTGFAGLPFWGTAVNTEFFNQGPLHCALIVPWALIWSYIPIKALQLGRRFVMNSDWIAKEDGQVDGLLKFAELSLKDGENDFFGIFLSFLIVCTLRFLIGGNLPNEEGHEGQKLFHHAYLQVFLLYVASFCCFCLSSLILKQKHDFIEKNKKHVSTEEAAGREGVTSELEEEEKEEEAFWHLSSSLWRCLGEGEWPSFIVKEGAATIKRMVDLAVNTMSFSFAFCFLYATQWWLAQIFLNEEAALSMVLAMVITVCSCFMLYVLDRMADESEEASASHGGVEKEDKVHRKLMEGIAILIGFVWEQSFDGALEGVAEKGNLWLKPLLGLLTAMVILPVWFWYIMPMETEAGYIIGLMPRAIKTRVANINFAHEPWLRKEVNAQVEEMLVVLCEEKVLELSNDFQSALKVDQSSKYKPPTPLESG